MMYCERLKDLREKNGLKQSDIGDILSINRNAYTQYEKEYTIMPIKHLIVISDFYNVSLDYIFEFSNIKNYETSSKNINKIKIGQRIKEFRKENKLTQINLAKELNIGNGTIADYERGRYLISTPALYTICKKYNISSDYLLGKIDEPKYLK